MSLRISKGDNSWMKHLNHGVANKKLPGNLSNYEQTSQQMIIELNDESNSYTYPDSDFCHFMYFPHENHVFPLINSKQNLSCSCTLIWLIQYLNESDKVLETKAIQTCMRDRDFKTKLTNCDFKLRLNECYRSERLMSESMVNSGNDRLFFDNWWLFKFFFYSYSFYYFLFNLK